MGRNCFDITAINEKKDVQMKTKTENIKAELEGSGFNVDVYECGQ